MNILSEALATPRKRQTTPTGVATPMLKTTVLVFLFPKLCQKNSKYFKNFLGYFQGFP